MSSAALNNTIPANETQLFTTSQQADISFVVEHAAGVAIIGMMVILFGLLITWSLVLFSCCFEGANWRCFCCVCCKGGENAEKKQEAAAPSSVAGATDGGKPSGSGGAQFIAG